MSRATIRTKWLNSASRRKNMLEMCVQQEIHQGKKRYFLSLEDDLGDSLYIMKELKKYVPESGLSKYSLEQIEKALHFGVAVDMCTTNVQRNQQLEYVSKYRIM